ncbi:MAG: glycosyltransferase family 39 protein [Gemmataceae bacterium]|nr:glycosyltransferase family 39 protein [Gemmataceae bacterium]
MKNGEDRASQADLRPTAGFPTGPTEARALRDGPRRRYRRLALLLLLMGLTCRTALYLLNHPLYMDEAFVTLNVVDRDYPGLARQLDESQVAPLLFLWGERAVYEALGPAEQALRLVPFLAGITALVLFWHLARRLVSPPAAAVAVGLLAVSRWPLHMTSQVKPYSLDLLASVVLLSLAVHWLRRPERLRWLVLLVLVTPIAVGVSYPAVFVAGGVGSVLLVAVWRRAGQPARLLVVAYGMMLAGSFLFFDVLIGQRQLGPPGDRLHDYMMDYWTGAFPPAEGTPLAKWLVLVHFGPLMGYPYGNGYAAGAITFPLFLVGAWACWRTGRHQLAALCLIPFALTLTAAFLHKYPYGGCTRMSQHLAPAVCLLAGLGLVRLVRLCSCSPAFQGRAIRTVGCVLAAYGVGLVVFWTLCPYRDRDDPWAKSVAVAVMTHAQPGDQVIVSGLPESVRAEISWYVLVNSGRPIQAKALNGTDAPARGGSVWLLISADVVGGPWTDSPVWVPAGQGPTRKVEHRATFTLPSLEGGTPALRVDLWAIPGAARLAGVRPRGPSEAGSWAGSNLTCRSGGVLHHAVDGHLLCDRRVGYRVATACGVRGGRRREGINLQPEVEPHQTERSPRDSPQRELPATRRHGSK